MRKNRQGGMTIVEVLIASTILAFTSVVLLKTLTVGDKIRSRSQDIWNASLVASNLLEHYQFNSLNGHLPRDSTYIIKNGKTEMEVQIHTETVQYEDLGDLENCKAVQIKIFSLSDKKKLVNFDFVQGSSSW